MLAPEGNEKFGRVSEMVESKSTYYLNRIVTHRLLVLLFYKSEHLEIKCSSYSTSQTLALFHVKKSQPLIPGVSDFRKKAQF